MDRTNKNYGRAGGRLDPTKHIEAAIPRLLKPAEIGVYCERTQAVLANGATRTATTEK